MSRREQEEIKGLIDETVYMSEHEGEVFDEDDKERKQTKETLETMRAYIINDPFLLMHSHMAQVLKAILDTKDKVVQKALIERSKTFVGNVLWLYHLLNKKR